MWDLVTTILRWERAKGTCKRLNPHECKRRSEEKKVEEAKCSDDDELSTFLPCQQRPLLPQSYFRFLFSLSLSFSSYPLSLSVSGVLLQDILCRDFCSSYSQPAKGRVRAFVRASVWACVALHTLAKEKGSRSGRTEKSNWQRGRACARAYSSRGRKPTFRGSFSCAIPIEMSFDGVVINAKRKERNPPSTLIPRGCAAQVAAKECLIPPPRSSSAPLTLASGKRQCDHDVVALGKSLALRDRAVSPEISMPLLLPYCYPCCTSSLTFTGSYDT